MMSLTQVGDFLEPLFALSAPDLSRESRREFSKRAKRARLRLRKTAPPLILGIFGRRGEEGRCFSPSSPLEGHSVIEMVAAFTV